MDEFYIAALENLERQENAVNYRKLSHSERFDAFLLPDYIFINNYRLTKDLVRYVINILTPHMTEATRTSALNIQTKVFIALNFFATGSYQLPVGNSNLAIVSQPTVSRAIDEVVNALNQPEIFKYWVKYPSTLIELRQTREKFNTKYNFPGIVGIIDCTHIGIFPPKTDDPVYPEYIYVNRKNYHSINVQLVCDSDMKIINVSALFPGSVNDAYIWNNSLLEPTLRRIYNHNPEGFYLLGDSGYPLRPWLMTPLMQYQPNTPEERYNRRFKHVRSLIERCIGLLKMRFRCLLKHRILHYSPVKACKIVNACTVLHNICIENNVQFQNDEDGNVEEIDLGIFGVDDNERQDIQGLNEDLVAGRRMQHRVIRYFA
ncbi:putative nuclease HARBI1 [Myzus persicae]|uniref:putative nuclease HARBI1 n=1 Tax=Myzus persicae TaxID=13164 RepID=UPI000B936A2D|nr:putative nuclease HARBI1 [Myzus persicae]